jgi:peptidoglycan/xylan/chitin deacetylase (PgdA/CDA1 family)
MIFMFKRFIFMLALLIAFPAVKVYASPDEPVALPILMYHQLLDGAGKRSKYVVSPKKFENDLKLLREYGYTTITVKDLTDYVYGRKRLPEKPVMITFDDGYESDYIYAFPLLKEYDMKAVFFVIGKYADLYSGDMVKHINYSHLSWEQIKEMHLSGHAEFHNHTYDMHNIEKRNGALRRKGESDAAYEKAIANDFRLLNEKYFIHIGTVPAGFACPFGAYNDDLVQAVKRLGYSAVLNSHERVNVLYGEPDELYRLGRYVRTPDMNLEKQLKIWESAYQPVSVQE